MKKLLAALLLLLLVGVTAVAQETEKKPEAKPQDTKAAETLPTVDQIIDKYVEALGGKAAIEKQTSRVTKGTFDIPAFGASGTWEGYAKSPNKTISIIDVPGFGVIRQAYDGTIAWEDNPQTGMNEKSGTALTRVKLDSDFYRDVKLKELYSKMTVKGKQKVGDKDAYVIEATPTGASAETWYFDAETGLLLRADAEREGPNGVGTVQLYLEDYRGVDGVKIPHTLRQTTPDFAISIKISEIKHNVDVEDTKFAKPAAK
jgi:outer membrane lipoprotein-sorting protein